jgi:mannosyltransferase OCH1-like enzyme
MSEQTHSIEIKQTQANVAPSSAPTPADEKTSIVDIRAAVQNPIIEKKKAAPAKAAELSKVIPKIIHFIWAGGIKKLPEKNRENIVQWIRANPGYQCVVWVDRATCGQEERVFNEEYQKLFAETAAKIRTPSESGGATATAMPTAVATAADSPPEIKIDRSWMPELRDIGATGFRTPSVAYQIERMHPNYGCSSDELRVHILLEQGGFYIDSDVGHNPNHPLDASGIFSSPTPIHRLYIDHFTQRPLQDAKDPTKYILHDIGNDTFACAPGNPVMNKIWRRIENAYQLDEEKMGEIVMLAHRMDRDRENTTIERTGPAMIVDVLRMDVLQEAKEQAEAEERTLTAGCLFKATIDGTEVDIHSVKPNIKECVTIPPKANFRGWLKADLRGVSHSIEEALPLILRNIQFEAEHFHFLRLDYHIETLIAAKIPPERAIASLLPALETILSPIRSKIKYTAITCKFKETIEFCGTQKLSNFFSFPKTLPFLIEMETQYKTLNTMLEGARLNAKGSVVNFGKTDEDLKKGIYQMISDGLQFMEKFLPHYHQALNAQQLTTVKFSEALTLYLEFIPLLAQDPLLFAEYGLTEEAASGRLSVENRLSHLVAQVEALKIKAATAEAGAKAKAKAAGTATAAGSAAVPVPAAVSPSTDLRFRL